MIAPFWPCRKAASRRGCQPVRAAEQEKLKPQPGQVCGDMERREMAGSGPAQVACSVFGRHPLLPSGTAVRGTGLMPTPPPRRVIYPIAAPITSPCPGTAVLGTALGHERDRRTARHGNGEARHGALQPRTAPATACTITNAKMIPTSLGATRRAFAHLTSRPRHSTHYRAELPRMHRRLDPAGRDSQTRSHTQRPSLLHDAASSVVAMSPGAFPGSMSSQSL